MTLKEDLYGLWTKKPYLSPYDAAKVLGLDYAKHGKYIRNLRTQFKCHLKNRQAQKCLKFHKTRGWIQADLVKGLQDRRWEALAGGWRDTHAKNKMIVFSSELGRLEWFRTGRVNFWVNKPATKSRLLQLLACGFTWTGLIRDIKVFEEWTKTARLKGAHLTYDLGEVLPYACVELLKESNGVVVKMGDISHRTSLEIEFNLPDYVEQSEKLQRVTTETLQRVTEGLSKALELSGKQQELLRQFMEDMNIKGPQRDPKDLRDLYG